MAQMTREQWLTIAAVRMVRSVRALCGNEYPENVRFSVGFPKRKRGRGAHAAGSGLYSLHVSGESTGGMRECFIAPTVGPADVGSVMLRALIEAAGGRAPSDADIAAAARHALQGMPPFPHDAMTDTRPAGSVGGTRMHKAACPVCGYAIRITRKWIAVGLPACPVHSVTLVCDTVNGSDSDT